MGATSSNRAVCPSGHVTVMPTACAAPKPKWIHPFAPLPWPPPTVTSRLHVRSPLRISIQAPIPFRFGPDCSRRTCSHLPAVSLRLWKISTGELRLTTTRSSRPSRSRSTSAAPRPFAMLAMPASTERSTKCPSGPPISKLLGSCTAPSGIASTLPLAIKRSMRPSLSTSPNSGCQAVDGRSSSPTCGTCAVTPRA